MLFYTFPVFARGHTDVFFKYRVKRGSRVETERVRDFRKGDLLSDKLFRLVKFEFQIGLIDRHTRLFTEKCAKLRRSVM